MYADIWGAGRSNANLPLVALWSVSTSLRVPSVLSIATSRDAHVVGPTTGFWCRFPPAGVMFWLAATCYPGFAAPELPVGVITALWERLSSMVAPRKSRS